MMSALRPGSVSAAAACTACRTTTSTISAAVRPQVGAQQRGQHGAPRCRRRGGTARRCAPAGASSLEIIGWLVDIVSAASQRAAAAGLDGDLVAVGLEQGDQCRAVGDRAAAVEAGTDGGHQAGDVERAPLQQAHGRGDRLLERRRRASIAANACSIGGPGRRPARRRRRSARPCRRRHGRSCPRRCPAASAIWRVVTISPCSSSSGSMASTIIARRSSGGIASARAREALVTPSVAAIIVHQTM